MSFEQWEGSKENIKPLKTGRNPQMLMDSLKDDTLAERLKTLEKQKQDWEFLLRNMDNHAEVLSYWWKYIRWLQQNYPTGGKKDLIKDVLQRCTQKFTNSDQYKNELVYIKIWILYADLCAEPLEVFHFMNSNQIGEYVSLFYEAWAIVLENQSDVQGAMQVYNQGIQKKAKPEEDLKKKKKEFEGRVMRKLSEGVKNRDEPEAETDENQRQPLQTLSKKQPITSSRQTKAPNGGLVVSTSSNSLPKTNQSNSFKIYQDDQPSSNEESLPSAPGWSTLPPEPERIKENTRESTSYREPLKSSQAPPPKESKASEQQFAIFVDEDCQKDNDLKEKKAAADRNIRGQLDVKVPQKAPAPPTSTSQPKPTEKPVAEKVVEKPTQSTQSTKPSSSSSKGQVKSEEKFIFEMTSLLVEGREVCFEELRSVLPKYQEVAIQPHTEEEEIDQEMDMDVEMDEATSLSISNNLSKSHPTPVKKSTTETKLPKEEKGNFSIFVDESPARKPVADPLPQRPAIKQEKIIVSEDKENAPSRPAGKVERPPLKMVGTNQENQAKDSSVPTAKPKQILQERPMIAKPFEATTPQIDSVKNNPFSPSTSKQFETLQISTDKKPQSTQPASTQRNKKKTFTPKKAAAPSEEQFRFLDESTTQVMKFLSEPNPDQSLVSSPSDVTTTQLTINTRQALQQVMKMFNTPLAANKRDSVSSRDSLFSVTPASSRGESFSSFSPGGAPSGEESFFGKPSSAPSFEVFEDSTSLSGIVSKAKEQEIQQESKPNSRAVLKEKSVLAPKVQEKLTNRDILEKSLGATNPALIPKLNQKRTYADIIQSSLKNDSFDQNDIQNFQPNKPMSFSVHEDTGEIPAKNPRLEVYVDEEEKPSVSRFATNLPSIIDPYDDKVIQNLVSRVSLLVSAHPKFHDLSSDPTPSLNSIGNCIGDTFELTESWVFDVKKKLGEGAFAQVFLVQKLDLLSLEEEDLTRSALKVEKKKNIWEFYLFTQITKRIPKNYHIKFPKIQDFLLCKNGNLTLLDYQNGGTLQDAINVYKRIGKVMPEELVLYYTLEIMHIVQLLHQNNLIHGDIKPDNFLILSQEETDWTPGWKDPERGLQLIDFGRGIDVSLFSPGTLFTGTFQVENFQCPEMLENKPWTYQIDLFGICATAYTMLHGEYLEMIKDSSNRWKPRQAFKRYWQKELWTEFFDAILNVPDCNSIPNLQVWINKFEKFLETNPLKSRNIKDLLTKQSNMIFDMLK